LSTEIQHSQQFFCVEVEELEVVVGGVPRPISLDFVVSSSSS